MASMQEFENLLVNTSFTVSQRKNVLEAGDTYYRGAVCGLVRRRYNANISLSISLKKKNILLFLKRQ